MYVEGRPRGLIPEILSQHPHVRGYGKHERYSLYMIRTARSTLDLVVLASRVPKSSRMGQRRRH